MQAIVLYTNKYPKGYMVHLYSRENGRITCVVNDTKSKKSTFRKSLLQPLSFVEIIIEKKSNNTLPYIKEGIPSFLYKDLPYNYKKNFISLFLAEVLGHILKPSEEDVRLYDFLEKSFLFLDATENSCANFHLTFLIHLTTFLGFEPNLKYEENAIFDLQEGVFSTEIPTHNYFLSKNDSKILFKMLRMNYENMSIFQFSGKERVEILNHILTYYKLHLEHFPTPKSLQIMQEIFR